MYYINYKYKEQPIETIDEAESMKEALYLLGEYVISDPSGKYQISRREY